jgi:addiction module HigA family antidote
MLKPAHPGQFIKREAIEPQGLTITDTAKVLGVTRPALSALLNGHASLTSEMALRFEKAFGVRMDTLVHMQSNYEIAAARARAGDIDSKPRRQPKHCATCGPRRWIPPWPPGYASFCADKILFGNCENSFWIDSRYCKQRASRPTRLLSALFPALQGTD